MNALPKVGWSCVEKQNIESLTVSMGCKFVPTYLSHVERGLHISKFLQFVIKIFLTE